MDTKSQWGFTTCTLRGSAILAHIRSTLVKLHCEVVPGMAQSGYGQVYISRVEMILSVRTDSQF